MNIASVTRPATPAPAPSPIIPTAGPSRAFPQVLFKTAREAVPILAGAWLFFLFWAFCLSYDMTGGYSRHAKVRDLFTDSTILAIVAIAFPLIGFLLGAVQSRSLRQPDHWAFFVHRPVPRSKLFAFHVSAGLGVYTAAIGIPWLIFLLGCAKNADVMPVFHVQYLSPYVATALTGALAYFCAIVLSHRQASWMGTAFLPLIAGLLFIIGSLVLETFQSVLIAEIVGLALFALASWGCFITNGVNHRLPVAARTGLCGILISGFLLPAFFIGPLADVAILTHADAFLLIGRNDLAHPFLLADGRVIIENADYHHAPSTTVTYRYFFPNGEPPPDALLKGHTTPEGRLAEDQRMNLVSAAYLESSPHPLPWNAGRFRELSAMESNGTDPSASPPFDPQNRSFTLLPREDFHGPVLSGTIAGDTLTLFDSVTAHKLLLPVTHSLRNFDLSIATTADKNFFVVWYFAPERQNEVRNWLTHVFHHKPCAGEYIELYDRTGKQLTSVAMDPANPAFAGLNLPGMTEQDFIPKPLLILSGFAHATGMSLTAVATRWLDVEFYNFYWNIWAFSATLLLNLAVAATLILLSHRYRLSRPIALLWAFAGLFIGPPLIIVFLGLYHRPLRTPCPHCQKPRPVTEPLCPHCKSPFPPPTPNGTEIFATP